jgi:hypothetical protein
MTGTPLHAAFFYDLLLDGLEILCEKSPNVPFIRFEMLHFSFWLCAMSSHAPTGSRRTFIPVASSMAVDCGPRERRG